MKRWHKMVTTSLLVMGLVCSMIPVSSQAAELSLWTRVAHVKDSYDWTISEFEKLNPDVRIHHRLIDWARTAEVLLPAFLAGIGPDIVNICDVSILKEFARQGEIMDLGEWYEKYGDRFPKSADIWVIVDGNYVAVPIVQVGMAHIFYNKDLTEKYGINPTDDWTWSEFLDVCEKLKNQGEIPIVQGNKEGLDGEHWIQMLLTETIGGTGIMELLQRTDPDSGPRWTDAKVVQAIQAFEDLGKYMIEGSAAVGQHAARLQFTSGKGVFKQEGTWLPAILANFPDFRWGFFRFPHMVGEIGATRNGGVVSFHDVLSVNAESENQDIALKFLEFYSRKDIMGYAFYDLKGWYPAAIGALADKELSEYDKAAIEFYAACDDNAVWLSAYLPPAVGMEYITRGSTSMSAGMLSANEFCGVLEKAHTDYLRELQK